MKGRVLWVLGTLILVFATIISWNHRYELDEECPKISLRSLIEANPALSSTDSSCLEISQEKSGEATAWEIPLTGMENQEILHIRVLVQAVDLQLGGEPWEKGLVFLEKAADPDFKHALGAVVNDEASPDIPQVIHLPDNKKPVTLRIEHHGRSGKFEIQKLEFFGLKKSLWGQVGWIFVSLGWLAWVACLVGWESLVRTILVALIWTGFAWKILLPGPWPAEHPIQSEFVSDVSALAEQSPTSLKAQDIQPMVKLPKDRSLLFYLKFHLPVLRPLMHGMLFFVPTFLFLLLRVPIVKSAILGAFLALGVELIQIGFGFYFDLKDLLDLLWDGLGIALAIMIWHYWQKRRKAVSP